MAGSGGVEAIASTTDEPMVELVGSIGVGSEHAGRLRVCVTGSCNTKDGHEESGLWVAPYRGL